MGDSLQDQLRALGLAKKQTGREKGSLAAKRSGRKHRKHPDKGAQSEELSLEKAYALKRREEQKQADKARRKKQAEDRQRRLLNNQIREIVKINRQNREDADIARNFLFRGRIRKVHVSPAQLRALNDGELGLVYLSGGYHLLEPEHVEKVRALSPDHVVELNSEGSDDDGEFPVPDDLEW